MPLLTTDYELKPNIYLNFVQGWPHKLYLSSFQNGNGVDPTVFNLTDFTNCSWDGTYLTPDIGQSSFSFKFTGSETTISGTAYAPLFNNISVSLLKSTLGISSNNYANIFTSNNINTHSKYYSNKTVPHSASEMRKYFHATGWGLAKNLVEVNTDYVRTIVQKEQNTPEGHQYKIDFLLNDVLKSSKTGNMSGVFHKEINSDTIAFTTSGYNTTGTLAVKFYNDDEGSWVEDIPKRHEQTVNLQGPTFMDGLYMVGTKLSKQITFSIDVLNQLNYGVYRYVRAIADVGGTQYQSKNTDSQIFISSGNNSFNITLNWEQVGLNTSTVVSVWLSTSSDGVADAYPLSLNIQ